MQVAVIGGTRGLGNWIANFLKESGCDVIITGRNSLRGKEISEKIGVFYTSNNIEAASKAEIVIAAVPIDVSSKIIMEVAPHLKEGSLLMDVTSVKEEPSRVMEEFIPDGVEFIPTHPMFGPRIKSLEGQVVVLTPLTKGKWYEKVIKFLESENTRVIETTPQIHDQMMSIVQGLTHFTYISIAVTLERFQVDVKMSRKFASPVYSLMLDMIARIVSQNPYMYYAIQTQNHYVAEVHNQFFSTIQELNDIITHNDEDRFVNIMSSAAKYLDDLEASLGRSDKAISALTGEIRILKSSLGEEVGLKHIYSGKIHLGILEDITPDFITLNSHNTLIKLKISNIEILSQNELIQYKNENYPKKIFDVSVILPQDSDPDVISNTLRNLEDVVHVCVKDVYKGGQIESGMKSITFEYEVINPKARNNVEKLLKGFGGILR
ncbi:MAG: prephenate dehydrogenase [Methanobacterium sp.]|jgi:prephenate dehydrogenase